MKGIDEYAGKPFTGLRALTYVLGTDLYFVVPTNSPIKSYADAKGKRIGVGGPGSTTANTALFLFEQHGVTKKDFKPQYYVFREIVEGIQNGSLDGGIFVGGYPIAAYAELSTQHNVRIVPLDESFLKKVTAEHPYYYRTVVKAKSYKGLEQDTPILGFTTAIYAHEGMSNDLVYKILEEPFRAQDRVLRHTLVRQGYDRGGCNKRDPRALSRRGCKVSQRDRCNEIGSSA